MASIVKRDGRFRVLIRKAGHKRCQTFSTEKAAKAWAKRIEGEIEELRSSGILQPGGLTVGDLIDKYTEELYAQKQWGRSKSADLSRLKRLLGDVPIAKLTSAHITNTFRGRHHDGAGPVTIAAQVGYLINVLKVARSLWHFDVPLQAAQDARIALTSIGLTGKSRRRDRRVSDAELDRVIECFQKKRPTTVAYPDVLRFALATGMRISEVCRIEWRDLNERDKTIIIRDRKHPTDRIGNDMVVPLLNATGVDAFAIVQRQSRGGKRIFAADPRTVSTMFTRCVASLDLEDLHLHDLRHEAISRLFEAGYRIEEVALVSGHRDWAMLKRYTHVKAKSLHREVRP